ncbi:hypothetical protein J7382_08550 [Shimia sp. R11_0]|uniref:hypothetical protein n=1 Tax=Shimia sp. R11_0 TaxID=2821096 RepID=UPI001AD9D936|nr:hypothetical protein [Shimia sp. R11_0]MBO9477579.1 hypothetical protein [Shimia sp. R11_0]
MEAFLNIIWSLIEAVPPVIMASIMLLGLSAVAATLLCLIVAAVTMRKERKHA